MEFVKKHPLLCGSLLLLVMLYYLPGLKLLLKIMQRISEDDESAWDRRLNDGWPGRRLRAGQEDTS